MESKEIPKIRIGANLADQTLTLLNLSDGPIRFEFTSIKGLEERPITVDPGTMLALRLTTGVAIKEPEVVPPCPSHPSNTTGRMLKSSQWPF